MKKRLALLLAGLLLLGLAGCGLPFLKTEESAPEAAGLTEAAAPEESTRPAPAVTLTLGAAEGEDARLDYAVDRLRQTLPDIALERAALPVLEAAQPDLLLLEESAVAGYAAAGLLADLTGEAKAAALLEALAPAERAAIPEGTLWALPQRAAEAEIFLVNDAVFAAAGVSAPRSLEELPAAAAALAAQGEPALILCPEDGVAAQALLEAFLWEEDGHGLRALYRGERSPYDEAFLKAAGALYRLGRADAVSLLSREERDALWLGGGAALIFVREDEAARSVDALGETVHLLPCRGVAAREDAALAVSAASEHPSLAVDAACLLCGYLAEYDLRFGCGAGLAYPMAAGEAPAGLARELAAFHAETSELTRLTPETEPALADTLTEGVWELLRGSMMPEELVELAAMALEK